MDSASPSQHLVAPRLSLKVPTDAGRGQAKLMDNRRKHGTPPSYSRRGRKKALPEIDVVLYFKLKLQQQRSIYDMRKVFFFCLVMGILASSVVYEHASDVWAPVDVSRRLD